MLNQPPCFFFAAASSSSSSSHLQLMRPGGIIAVDNTIWSGKILSDEYQDEDTVAIRKLNDFVAMDQRVDSTLLNMADGVLLAIKK